MLKPLKPLILAMSVRQLRANPKAAAMNALERWTTFVLMDTKDFVNQDTCRSLTLPQTPPTTGSSNQGLRAAQYIVQHPSAAT